MDYVPILIRQDTKSESQAVLSVITEAFKDPRVGQLICNLRASTYFNPQLSVVATRNDEIVGYALYFPVMVQDVGQATKAVHMAPIAVRNVEERQGIGERLVRHGMQRAHSLGYETVLVLGPVEYFSSFGFEKAETLGFKANLPFLSEYFLVHMMRPELHGVVKGVVLYPPRTFSS